MQRNDSCTQFTVQTATRVQNSEQEEYRLKSKRSIRRYKIYVLDRIHLCFGFKSMTLNGDLITAYSDWVFKSVCFICFRSALTTTI